MSQNTDIHVYDIVKLEEVLIQNIKDLQPEQLEPIVLLHKVMPKVGVVLDNKYFILQNEERWDDYSPWTAFLNIFERYYQRTDMYELSGEAQIAWKYDGANAYDVLSEIGIDPDELPPHPYDEEE